MKPVREIAGARSERLVTVELGGDWGGHGNTVDAKGHLLTPGDESQRATKSPSPQTKPLDQRTLVPHHRAEASRQHGGRVTSQPPHDCVMGAQGRGVGDGRGLHRAGYRGDIAPPQKAQRLAPHSGSERSGQAWGHDRV
jgi:hypothetical protein